jgi:glutamate decarboxylase
MYLSWQYYGKAGLSGRIKTAYTRADELYSILESSKDIIMVSRRPLPCLQVCFYYAPEQQVLESEKSTRITQDVVHALVSRGFMIDYAPGEKGKFFRVVVHPGTTNETVRRLAASIEELGRQVFDSI